MDTTQDTIDIIIRDGKIGGIKLGWHPYKLEYHNKTQAYRHVILDMIGDSQC